MSQWDERQASTAASCSPIAPSGSCANRQLAPSPQRYSQVLGLKDLLSLALTLSPISPALKGAAADLAPPVWLENRSRWFPIPPEDAPTYNSVGDPEHERKTAGCH